MKPTHRVKGINCNYDLPEFLYVVGLDSFDVPMIQEIAVTGVTSTKLLKLKEAIRVKPIAKMHWDSVHKHTGTKTIPYKSVGDNPERGYVFTSKWDAIGRISHMHKQLQRQLEELSDHTASVAARYDRYHSDYFKKKIP